MSGSPINIIQGNAGNLNAGGSGQFPDLVKTRWRSTRTTRELLGGVARIRTTTSTSTATAFAAVNIPAGQPQRFGNSPRNPIRGPGFWNVDLGLFRTIGLAGIARLQFRVEALNVLNHPNFANPGADISNAGTFGFITGTTGTGERTIRLGARFSF